MTNYFIPFIALALFIIYKKLTKAKKKKRFSAPPSHQLPTQMENKLEKIIEIINSNTYNEELADQYLRDFLDQEKVYD